MTEMADRYDSIIKGEEEGELKVLKAIHNLHQSPALESSGILVFPNVDFDPKSELSLSIIYDI